MAVIGEKVGLALPEQSRLRRARALDWSIIVLIAASLYFAAASAWIPRPQGPIDVAEVNPDGGNAFTFDPDFHTHWPYAIPSQPNFPLSRGDIQLTEDGQPLGTLEPSHDTIRRLGEGRFSFWQDTLWFSTSDNTDPRTNGRSYTIRVKGRLSPSAHAAERFANGALIVLILCPFGPVLASLVGRTFSRLLRRSQLDRRVRAGVTGLSSVVRRVPLTFNRTFVLVSAAVLAGFCLQSLVRPMPLVFEPDSLGYVYPGLEMAAGVDVKGASERDLGYPALTWLATRLGSLSMIPRLQLFVAVAGLALILCVLLVGLKAMATRLNLAARIPRPFTALVAAVAAAAYCCLLLSHDLFVLNIYSAMAEAPHLLPTALAMLLFIAGWIAGAPERRVSLFAAATAAAYLSVMVKPHTSMVVALCAASLLVVGARHYRVWRSPRVIAVCVAWAALVVGVHRLDAWVTPSGNDFGPKTLFCNHLDVIEPTLETSTPERARVATLMRGVLGNPDGWKVTGFNGDRCFYNQPFTDAILAAARADGAAVGPWQQREFLKAVLRNPIAYGRHVGRQMIYFMEHPVDDITITVQSHVYDDAWERLSRFSELVRMPREAFEVDVGNWVPARYPLLARHAKSVLQDISDSFAAVTLLSAGFALAVMAFLRKRADLRPEIVLLATAAFTLAFALTTALAHTFDIGRYLTDILPFSLVWWVIAVAYLAHGLVLVGQRLLAGHDPQLSDFMRKVVSSVRKPRVGRRGLQSRLDVIWRSAARVARYVPLTFARTFVLVSAAILIAFCWQTLARPMPLLFTGDSFGYIYPGLEMAAGLDAGGTSVRDVGYPALTLLAARLGSLSSIPRLQLFIVATGLACTLAVLFVALEGMASRLRALVRLPGWVLAVCAAAAAAVYCTLMLSHDLFVLNIYSLMAEAPHVLPTALTLLFFVAGFVTGPPTLRVSLFAMAAAAAYLSVMVKPHTSMVFALCVAALLVASVRHFRAFRSFAVLAVCVASAGLALAVHRIDVWITPAGDDFGPKAFFCNHLDVIEPSFDVSTPERARILTLMRGVLENTIRWDVTGFDGDLCVYDQAFTDAIVAAAKSEGLPVASWQLREFLKAVLRHPLVYGGDVLRQMTEFMVHPIDAVTYDAKSKISDSDWNNLSRVRGVMGVSRDELESDFTNWVPVAYPELAAFAKSLLDVVFGSFAAITLGSTALALTLVAFFRKKADLRPEIVLLATSAFTLFFALTVALAHTFDVTRYLTDILPFTILWWVMAAAYLTHGVIFAGALAARGRRRTATIDPALVAVREGRSIN